MATYTAEFDQVFDTTLDALASEIAAMEVIAKALSNIRDRETRQRVLSWAHDRFTVAPPPMPMAAAAPAVSVNTDPTLEVDSLAEFFDRPQTAAELLALHAASAFPEPETPDAASNWRAARERGPIGILVHGISRGLELIAAQWQTA